MDGNDEALGASRSPSRGPSLSPSSGHGRHPEHATPTRGCMARGSAILTRRAPLGTSRDVNRDRGNAKRRDPDQESARLVLASASPRRREILREADLLFDVLPAALDETPLPAESPAALVERLAREKALDVARRLPGSPARLVLGSDTIVVAPDDRILGKPRDAEHAVEQLARIVGRWHQVMTAIAVARSGGEAGGSGDAGTRSRIVVTRVEMRPATREELAEYVALGESFDKAGGYALQGGGSRFVLSVEGSRSNVIGLPLEETLALLEEARRDWLESSVSLLPETG